jgi:hypothetical protein
MNKFSLLSAIILTASILISGCTTTDSDLPPEPPPPGSTGAAVAGGGVTGMAAHTVYAQFAEPLVSYTINSQDFTFTSTDDTDSISIQIDDDAVYRYAYVSKNGNNWEAVPLTGNARGGNWLTGTATGTEQIMPSEFGLTTDGQSVQRNFVVTYSCTKTVTGWDCHSGWQIWQFNTSLEGDESPFVPVDFDLTAS